MQKLNSRRGGHEGRTSLLCAVAIVTVVLASAACDDDSPTGPIAQTRVDARVQDSTGSSTVTGAFAGNFQASIWDGDRWVDLGSPNGITVGLQSGASDDGPRRTERPVRQLRPCQVDSAGRDRARGRRLQGRAVPP